MVEADSFKRYINKRQFWKSWEMRADGIHVCQTKAKFKIHSNNYFIISSINKMIFYFLT